MTPKIIFKNLDYICHKSVELQKYLKHFKFWKYFYCKHDKATLSTIISPIPYTSSTTLALADLNRNFKNYVAPGIPFNMTCVGTVNNTTNVKNMHLHNV